MLEDKKWKKLSDNEFWTILRKNAGLYSRTARAIEKEFGCSYTRQSVQERAEKKPDLLKDIREANIDIAEEGLQDLMRSKKEKIKLESVKFFLKTQGKNRGYAEKQIIEGGLPAQLTQVNINTLNVTDLDEFIESVISERPFRKQSLSGNSSTEGATV